MSQKQQLCGVRIDAYVATYNDLPLVTVKKLGADADIFLTSEEARLLAAALVAAAKFADSKESP